MTTQIRCARLAFCGAMLLASGLIVAGCALSSKAVVPLRVQRLAGTPRDAEVVVDEEYVGPLYLVATQGLRLPVGQHRITVKRDGYFPCDRLVVADRAPIELAIKLVPVPE